MWINYLANDKTCLNCEVESDSRPEANDHLSKYHLLRVGITPIKARLALDNPISQ